MRRYLVERLDESTPDPTDFLEGTQRILADANDSTDDFLAIWVTDPAGKVVTATDDQYLGRDYSLDADYQYGLRERHLGTPRREADGSLVAQLVTPARGYQY